MGFCSAGCIYIRTMIVKIGGGLGYDTKVQRLSLFIYSDETFSVKSSTELIFLLKYLIS